MKIGFGIDLLSEDRIRAVINTEFFGNKIFAFWNVGSTNEFAYQRALQGDPEGTMVIAEEQKKGRGRKSRKWESPFNKGLWFSLILRPKFPSSKAGMIPFFASVSIAEAIENYLGLKPAMKWPNDLLINTRKFCGILSEVDFKSGHINFIIVGIGINVNHKLNEWSDEINSKVTSLRIESGNRIDRTQLLSEILTKLESNYLQIRDKGFNEIISKWKTRCPRFGKEIDIIQENATLHGVFQDLDDEGCIILDMGNGTKTKISSGDFVF